MKKTDKKTDKMLREALTRVCETALEQVPGFQWLTHFVNYRAFPESLSVVCVFDSNSEFNDAKSAQQDIYLMQLIEKELASAGIRLPDIRRRVLFDTEENCRRENNGKWQHRFNH
ncbi:Fis family transcriptional regulator [Thalassomonas viridans]|uniref:Fis family transcriptional regulator n=1 Tax=Thalassomonas viridans TaxID=137584 RepID=A0AAF0CE06_9GAMM|nr:hypothetical protein [Thalassomonas viridans]WDE08893.1 Fis family transcriptional regulator [Thalassomonas viridans]WDE08940.1 Fis family transcriptional regulator [Thalassomonas viridans]